MATIIDLSKTSYFWSNPEKSIYLSERDVLFATKYNVISDSTGKEKLFDFKHATGPEFSPETQWVYESEDGITLKVCNDPETTKKNAQNYLKAKLTL